jgi:hypothetical protein
MKYAVKIGSGTMICTSSSIKVNSGIRKFIGEGGYTDREELA